MWLGIVDDPEQITRAKAAKELNSDLVKVTRLTVFDDSLAYGSKRGIYIIEDTITGTKFLGVSGIGIAEAGSHTETRAGTGIKGAPAVRCHCWHGQRRAPAAYGRHKTAPTHNNVQHLESKRPISNRGAL